MSWLCSKAPNNFHLHLLKAKFVSHPSLPLWLLTLTYSASGILRSIFLERLRTLTFAVSSVMWLTLHFLEDIIQTSLGERLSLTTLFDTAAFSNVLCFSACSTLSSLLYFLSLSTFKPTVYFTDLFFCLPTLDCKFWEGRVWCSVHCCISST